MGLISSLKQVIPGVRRAISPSSRTSSPDLSDHDSRLLTSSDFERVPRLMSEVDGWLWPDAGWFTIFLAHWQSENTAERGGALEFGTYKGKYLSLLFHATEPHGEPVTGLDIYTLTTPEEVRGTFAKYFSSLDRLVLRKEDTRQVTTEKLREILRDHAPRLVSIDADHSREGVMHDLALATQVVSRQGVIAIDDFTNVHCPGVTEGAIKFLDQNREAWAPFASCCNKLFVCHASMHDKYLDLAHAFVRDVKFTTSSRRFSTRTRSQNEQRLCGWPIWVISHVDGGKR